MSIGIVFVEHNDGKILKASLSALQAAQELKTAWGLSELQALVCGPGAKAVGAELGGYGITKSYVNETEAFKNFRAYAYAAGLKVVIDQSGASAVIAASTSSGKDFLPRVAAHFEAGQASDVVKINSDGTLVRPMYAGNAFASVAIGTDKKFVTVRATAFTPIASAANSCPVEEFSASFDEAKAGEVVSFDKPQSARPELSDAAIVVSGGRALQSAENFEKFIFPLADALGAAVGASRAAVDSGYAPNDWQVGQTGKVVAPTLYIAVGISGAIQHLAGMKDSKVIVAINKDGEAPIYEVADYGLVADLYQVIEPLTAAFKAARS